MTNRKKFTEPEVCRCYISKEKSAAFGGEGTGEGFWIEKKSPRIAVVRNILLCGLGIGDEIFIKEYPDDGRHHPNEFVKLKKKVCQVYGLRYTVEGMKDRANFSKREQSFIRLLSFANIKMEGVMFGLASLQRPTEMEESDFFDFLNSGPFQFDFSQLTGSGEIVDKLLEKKAEQNLAANA